MGIPKSFRSVIPMRKKVVSKIQTQNKLIDMEKFFGK